MYLYIFHVCVCVNILFLSVKNLQTCTILNESSGIESCLLLSAILRCTSIVASAHRTIQCHFAIWFWWSRARGYHELSELKSRLALRGSGNTGVLRGWLHFLNYWRLFREYIKMIASTDWTQEKIQMPDPAISCSCFLFVCVCVAVECKII